MASVQELIAASRARRPALAHSLEGIAEGVLAGIQPDAVLKQQQVQQRAQAFPLEQQAKGLQIQTLQQNLQIQEQQEERKRANDEMFRNIVNGTETRTMDALNQAGTPKRSMSPSSKMAAGAANPKRSAGFQLHAIKTDPSGYLSGMYKLIDAVPKGESNPETVAALVDAIVNNRMALSQVRGRGNHAITNQVAAELSRMGVDVMVAESRLARRKAFGRIEGKVGTEDRWMQLAKEIDHRTMGKSKLLGMAGFANARVDRAYLTLMAEGPEGINPKRIGLAIEDLINVMKGGVPTLPELEQQEYRTLLEKAANIKTKITGKVERARIPEIVQELKDIMMDVKVVDNKIIRNNLRLKELIFAQHIATNQPKWEAMQKNITDSLTLSAELGNSVHSDVILTPKQIAAKKRLTQLRKNPAASPQPTPTIHFGKIQKRKR